MRRHFLTVILVLTAISGSTIAGAQAPSVTVGSKSFTESVILGDILTGLARNAGATANHRKQLGGTRILWNALLRGEIDAYPEYTGTIAREILSGQKIPSRQSMIAALASKGISMSAPLGFNNTYALAVTAQTATKYSLKTISDLQRHTDLRLGFSNEFMDRGDGWPALKRRYSLPQNNARGLDHDLAYRGLQSGDIDVIDVYTTDAEIPYYDLTLLDDDLGHFPRYDAVILYRSALAQTAPAAVSAFNRLTGKINAGKMAALNASVKVKRQTEGAVAADFLNIQYGVTQADGDSSAGTRLYTRTLEHLFLVGISLFSAILVAIPLGILAVRHRRTGQIILSVAGILQTIPGLALLVFMIPLLGIGSEPAIAALFLYSLLPIIRNTHTGISGIDPSLQNSAIALGLPPRARLRLIELPLAIPSIMAGIKTSAVINIGTATLGALIGAGGYGQPILTGIRLDNTELILEGAIPAALMALAVQYGFEWVERRLAPSGRAAAQT
ncbi:MAG: ABC transporter permease subunit [Alphaproteobacteria bacterium]|nr:ABC transporter permease subunit [Alphaproteobacteria bacterium]